MSKKARQREFHFSFTHIFRWLIFAVICYLTIQYLSTTPKASYDPTLVLGENTNIVISDTTTIYQSVLQNFSPEQKTQFEIFISNISSVSGNLPNFINQQIINFKKDIITQVYNDLLKAVEKK